MAHVRGAAVSSFLEMAADFCESMPDPPADPAEKDGPLALEWKAHNSVLPWAAEPQDVPMPSERSWPKKVEIPWQDAAGLPIAGSEPKAPPALCPWSLLEPKLVPPTRPVTPPRRAAAMPQQLSSSSNATAAELQAAELQMPAAMDDEAENWADDIADDMGEAEASRAHGIPWMARGPPPGEPCEYWRGQRWRATTERWSRRGGKHRGWWDVYYGALRKGFTKAEAAKHADDMLEQQQ